MSIDLIRNKLEIFRPKSQVVNFFDPNTNASSTRLFKFKDEQGNKFKIWIFKNLLKVEISLTTTLLFSINIPDKVCLADKNLVRMDGIGKIYTANTQNDQIVRCIELLKDGLHTLAFENDEGLTVYRNLLQLTIKHDRQLLPEIEVCKKFKSILERRFPEKAAPTKYSDLPIALRKILLKYENLAVSDDLRRDEMMEGMSAIEREDLKKAIEPRFEEINLFLESFGDKLLPESAIRLQNLAELTNELMNEGKKN